MVDIPNLFRPIMFTRPVRSVSETMFDGGRVLQTLITTWDDDGRIVRKEVLDAQRRPRVVTVRRHDEPGFVKTERTENARGELLGTRHVRRSAGGELVAEAWHAIPPDCVRIDHVQFNTPPAERTVHHFDAESRLLRADFLTHDGDNVATLEAVYDDLGRRSGIICQPTEVRYRYGSNEIIADVFLFGQLATTRRAVFDSTGRVIRESNGPTEIRFEYALNAEGDWIRCDVFDANAGERGSTVERVIVYRHPRIT